MANLDRRSVLSGGLRTLLAGGLVLPWNGGSPVALASDTQALVAAYPTVSAECMQLRNLCAAMVESSNRYNEAGGGCGAAYDVRCREHRQQRQAYARLSRVIYARPPSWEKAGEVAEIAWFYSHKEEELVRSEEDPSWEYSRYTGALALSERMWGRHSRYLTAELLEANAVLIETVLVLAGGLRYHVHDVTPRPLDFATGGANG